MLGILLGRNLLKIREAYWGENIALYLTMFYMLIPSIHPYHKMQGTQLDGPLLDTVQ